MIDNPVLKAAKTSRKGSEAYKFRHQFTLVCNIPLRKDTFKLQRNPVSKNHANTHKKRILSTKSHFQ